MNCQVGAAAAPRVCSACDDRGWAYATRIRRGFGGLLPDRSRRDGLRRCADYPDPIQATPQHGSGVGQQYASPRKSEGSGLVRGVRSCRSSPRGQILFCHKSSPRGQVLFCHKGQRFPRVLYPRGQILFCHKGQRFPRVLYESSLEVLCGQRVRQARGRQRVRSCFPTS